MQYISQLMQHKFASKNEHSNTQHSLFLSTACLSTEDCCTAVYHYYSYLFYF